MEPFIGQICLFGFDYAPTGWALCNGQTLSIAQNSALYSLLGTRYGGDGVSSFMLPNLQGRVPLGQGTGTGLSPYTMGEQGGNQTVTISTAQLPAHNHMLTGSGNAAAASTLNGNVLASSNGSTSGEEPVTVNAYGPAGETVNADPSAISSTGGNQPVDVRQPYLVLNYCIALQGIWPSRP